jgi:PAS domain S-box-containing protein
MLSSANPHLGVCLKLTQAISSSATVEEIFDAVIDAFAAGLQVHRASILLFDASGVMRFVASRGISDRYRTAVEGHSPWTPASTDAVPIIVGDVAADPSLSGLRPVFASEGIGALTFIPLVSMDRVIGKFMLYFDAPHVPGAGEMQLACLMASQVAFAVQRITAEAELRRHQHRLRFALDAAAMGTWDWDLTANTVEWSENLAGLHGLPADAFDGSFASYEREIHPEDRPRVLASAQRALTEGIPHDVEYRIVAPDGSVRWVEGKGRVEYRDGRPVRLSGVCIMATRRKEAELARLAIAEDASRTKDEFLATLSHELRTPLNAILGWVHLLQSGALPPARFEGALDTIARNARLQAQLIEDILDVSRIIAGKLELEKTAVALPALLETAISAVLPAATAKGVCLTSDLEDCLPSLAGDAKRLQQVLGNVLANAVKFTPSGGEIVLRCAVHDGEVCIEVRDTGAGIAPQFLPHVFERFRQADSRTTRQHGGLGLGLAIARHLVQQHGGRIGAHSDGPGHGTLISIALPIPASAGAASLDAPSGHASSLAGCLEGATVLVVDDDQDSRELCGVLLETAGASVTLCGSAAAALDCLETTAFDLVIADIAMPGVDGYAFIAQVRARRAELPAIAMSAHARIEDRRRALAAGYTAYRTKPVDGPQLIIDVADLLARRLV